MLNGTIATVIGAAVALAVFSPNELYARAAGAHAMSAHSVARPASANRFRAANLALRHRRRFRGFAYPWWPADCAAYGSCATEPYEPFAEPAEPPVSTMVLRQPCELQARVHKVRSERGGTADVKIIACRPVTAASARPAEHPELTKAP